MCAPAALTWTVRCELGSENTTAMRPVLAMSWISCRDCCRDRYTVMLRPPGAIALPTARMMLGRISRLQALTMTDTPLSIIVTSSGGSRGAVHADKL